MVINWDTTPVEKMFLHRNERILGLCQVSVQQKQHESEKKLLVSFIWESILDMNLVCQIKKPF